MPSTTVLLLLISPVLLFTLWHISSTIVPPPIPSSLRNKRIILLIAHPDDESMFFSPSLQALTDPALGNHLKILCMSTGNADGLGDTRRKELETAALTLGVRQAGDVFVMDDARFKDGMKEDWSPKEIARVLAQAFAPQLIKDTPVAEKETSKTKSSTTKSSSKSSTTSRTKSSSRKSISLKSNTPKPEATPEGPRASIDTILTFDSNGISSHPNHIALHSGSRLFLQHMMKSYSGYRCPIDLYTLTSISLPRKYTFVFDVIPTYLHGIFSAIYDGLTGKTSSRQGRTREDRVADRAMFVSGLGRYFKARKAMVQGHRSQMVWFRWGWIGLGRYMVINDLRRESVAGS